ncbi:DNA topoisomerase IV subunit A [Elysia marginata]|uniref:DNA topoisomerase IV subunit A n=1 Tax=Elysia marginata TaxID=1093978 RepID=A0AAV4FVH2_9GAST|nr:DNA topoisomerase IV subunit A [Elysia marginata]
MYQNWFLDYASYVILERAIPAIADGLKPVQRRILHAMKELDDGRYNKVANIVGHTMQYHPHGDVSIADAMTQMGQKELLIDMQGNWGNIFTGDSAAASRYIEARLSKFASDVVFSPKVTHWQLSYDGRKKEPINLPIKFPLLLVQGAEGIAVGLSTKILPHNFNELIDASVKHLKGKSFDLYPDFLTGGILDVSQYNDGKRGGRVRVRAKIEILDRKTLVIKEIPFSTNTSTLIDSILKANDKGKIKINKIEDNTSAEVEILVHLPSGVSPDKTIAALYAFTSCEVNISPLGCVIEDNKPLFIGVSEVLKKSTDHTVELLKRELEIQLEELEQQWHFLSLERIFIAHRIYRDIENQDSWQGVINAIDEGLKPHIKKLKRAVTEEDIIKLTEIKIKRISKFDANKANQKIESVEEEMQQIEYHLKNLIDFAIAYFNELKKKYGKDKKRATKIIVFDDIEATKVVMKNAKLFVNRKEGFVGTALKKDEFVCNCSDIDNIITFTQSGKMMVSKITDKQFICKDIIHIDIFKKGDRQTTYNMIYEGGKGGRSYIKRFFVSGITRDKEYDLTQGGANSKVLYFSANPNRETEVVSVYLRQTGKVKNVNWDVDFSQIDIKGRQVRGNLFSKYPIKKITVKEKRKVETIERSFWYDKTTQRLNNQKRGVLLGKFSEKDRVLIISKSGILRTVLPEFTTFIEKDAVVVEKWNPEKIISAIYYDGNKKQCFAKRFLIEKLEKEEKIITAHHDSNLEWISTEKSPVVEIEYIKPRNKTAKPNRKIILEEFITVKGISALGNQVAKGKIKRVKSGLIQGNKK